MHNNCEHFARYCYLGESRCEVTESVVNTWKNKAICDVYISMIPDEIEYKELKPIERNKEIVSVSNEVVKKSKYWVWKTLEYALFRSFGYKIEDLDIVKTKTGKWISKQCFFSLSHTNNVVAVVVSNRETGIDVEDCLSFYHKIDNDKAFDLFAKKIVSKKEERPQNKTDLLTLWTKKECLYKAKGKRKFSPNKICTMNQEVSSFQMNYGEKDYVVSIMGNNHSVFRFYSYDGESATRYKDIKWI